MTHRSLVLALSALLAVGLVAGSAVAQTDPGSDEALRRAYEADDLFARGRWNEAHDRFAEAEAAAHSPVFVLYMARSRRNSDRLLEARALYRRVAAEKLDADAPEPWRKAVSDAGVELTELGALIPSLRIEVTGAPPGENLRITVDGKPSREGVVSVDPGRHDVVASAGAITARTTIVVGEGNKEAVVRIPLAGEEEEGSLVPGILALSLGGAGLILGAIAGGIAAAKAGDIKEGCEGDHCLVEDAEELDTAKALATTSTVAFIVGGVGVATGTVLLIVRPGGSDGATGLWLGMRAAF